MRFTSKLGAYIVIVILPVLMAGKAGAIDLTGTWQDKTSSCKELLPNGETFSSDVFFSSMLISQSGTDLAVDQGVFNYDGLVYEDAKKGRGKGVIQKCLPDAYLTNFVIFHITTAETFAPNSKGVSGQMKTTVVDARKDVPPGSGFFDECEVVWERVSEVNPGAIGCN